MPFFFKIMLMYLGLFLMALIGTFVSEITYRKRTIQEVRRDWRQIARKTSLIFGVFVVASILWNVFGVKGE